MTTKSLPVTFALFFIVTGAQTQGEIESINFDNLELSGEIFSEAEDTAHEKTQPSIKKFEVNPYLLSGSDDLQLVGLDIFTAYEGPFSNKWYFDTSFEINFAQTISESETRNINDVRFKAHKFNVQHSDENHQVIIGWQTLSVGSIEGAEVVDVISPTSSALNSNIAGEKISQPMLVGHYYGSSQVSAFISLYPSHSLVFDENIAAQDLNLDNQVAKADVEYGLALTSRFNRVEAQFVAAELLPNIPIASDGSIITTPYQLVGISANYPIQKWLLKAEVASKQETQRNATEDRIEVSLGTEIDTARFGMFSTFVVGTDWKDEKHPDTDRWVGAWSDQFMNDTLTLSGSVSQLSGFQETGIAIDVQYQYSDLIRMGLNLIKVPPQFDRTDDLWQIKLGIEWVY